MDDCLFCKIVAGSVQSTKIIETAHSYAFYDIRPKAPTHVLIIPKRHIERPEELQPNEITDMLACSEEVAQITGVKAGGYRLLFNVGKNAGQEIDHVHLHLIGGAPSAAMY